MSFMAHRAVRRKRDFGAGAYTLAARRNRCSLALSTARSRTQKKHAEAAMARLKERIRKNSVAPKKASKSGHNAIQSPH